MSQLSRHCRHLFFSPHILKHPHPHPHPHPLHSLSYPLLKPLSTSTPTPTNQQQQQPTGGPPPIQVSFTESAGRGVFATRKIPFGQLIHTANPVVCHPSLLKLDTVCYLCLRSLKGGKTPFCSDECGQQAEEFYNLERKADWSVYHNYCRSQGLKYPLLVKRLACMVASGSQTADCLNILQPAVRLPEVDEEYKMLRSALEAMALKNIDLTFLTKQWYSDVLARVRINAFRVEMVAGSYEDLISVAAASVEAEAGVGNAVYLLPSFYNHDCDPNVHIIWIDNVTARLKALRDIEEGEELRICYIDTSMEYEARQSILLGGFGFKCSCHRCMLKD